MKHLVPLKSDDVYINQFNWCEREVGQQNKAWMYSWKFNVYYFKREEDKVKFILRWI